jgi:flagellar M-ring protein FliF
MNAVLDGLKALGAARLVALAAVGIAMLGMLGLLAMRGGASPGRLSLLYADLDPREAAQIAEALDRAHIQHDEPGAGDRVLVPSTDVARARMLLAKDGLPSGGSIGYEIFDRGDSMTASDFQQEINQTRALEGEIARSIRMLTGVRAARVHVVLPRHTPFAHDQQPAQASVVLTMAGSARLDSQGVQAVLNLVAAAVPGLKPQGVAIIDSRGTLLARAGQPAPDDAGTQTGEEIRRATEVKLSRAVEDMLERSLGPGHVRAEAAVDMNFDHVNETTENYNPDQQVVRSSQSVSDNTKSTEGEKSTTVQNNLPNADAGAQGQTGSTGQRTEETTNYEIGKVVHTLIREQPQIARISLAVMVDGAVTPGPDGKLAWHERDADDLARIKRLVQSAVGFDAKRGDTVEIVSMRFVQPDEGSDAPRGAFGLGLEKADLMGLAQSGILGLVILMALLFVLRPLAVRLSESAMLSVAGDAPLLAGPGGVALSGALGGALGGAGVPALAGGGRPGMIADESMVDLANIEGQIRASSLRKLSELVQKHPDESLSIMRAWMNQETG